MPSPVFIVCSEGGSIDRHTNMLSIFDVIERIRFYATPVTQLSDAVKQGVHLAGQEQTKPAAFNAIRMVAVWRQEQGDAGQEFEFRTLFHVPGMKDPIVAGEGRFVFKTTLHRLLATLYSEMPAQSGDLVVASEIKPP